MFFLMGLSIFTGRFFGLLRGVSWIMYKFADTYFTNPKLERMMKRHLLMAAVTLCMGSACTISASDNDNEIDKYDSQLLQAGTAAPDFTITNAQYPDGLKLSALRGKWVVVDFWASWCPDCRKDIPRMVELYRQYKDKGVEFVGVSFDTDSTAWQNCIAKNGMDWTQYSELKKWKKETTIDTLYKVNWIPTTYLIDREGIVTTATVSIDRLASALENIK